jgi:hypothetical protein
MQIYANVLNGVTMNKIDNTIHIHETHKSLSGIIIRIVGPGMECNCAHDRGVPASQTYGLMKGHIMLHKSLICANDLTVLTRRKATIQTTNHNICSTKFWRLGVTSSYVTQFVFKQNGDKSNIFSYNLYNSKLILIFEIY